MAKKMGEEWENTVVEMDALGWDGKPIHLTGVRAMRDLKTKQVLLDPSEVAKAESRLVAKQNSIEGRDIPLFLMLYAPPGIFEGGEIFYQYRINKVLFYQWQDLDKVGMKEGLEHDEFEPADRGPIPKNIKADLERLKKQGLIQTEYHRWGTRPKDESLRITLTDNGKKLAEKLWFEVPNPVREVTLRVKEHLYLRTPAEIKNRVHADFPEYKRGYTKEDID